MKYLPLLFAITFALLFATREQPAQADDPKGSLLEALSKEMVATVARADAARVSVQANRQWYRAVLVGTPARVVTPFLGDRNGGKIVVRLADGTEHKTHIIDGDSELGISVVALPAGAPAGQRGLDLAQDASIRRGVLGVLAGEAPALALVKGVDRAAGRFRADVQDDATALFGPGGRLMGLRSVLGPRPNCSACHTKSAPWHARLVPGSHTSRVVQPYHSVVDLHGLRAKFNTPLDPLMVVPYRAWASSPPPSFVPLRFQSGATTWPHGNSVSADAGAYVSAKVIRRVLTDIDQHGRIQRAYLGVVPGAYDSKAKGVRLSAVLEDSPAHKAGLRTKDIILSIDEVPCTSVVRLTLTLAHKRPGDRLQIDSHGRDPLRVTLGDLGELLGALETTDRLGVEVRPLDASLREWLKVPDDLAGVLLMDVKGARARQAGLRRGDVIVGLDSKPVRDVEELDAALAASKGVLNLRVQRGSKQVDLKLQPRVKSPHARSPR